MRRNGEDDLMLIVGLIIIAIAVTALTFLVVRVLASAPDDHAYCYHPLTTGTRIFMGECLNEGYSFGQCYRQYVDAVEHGSVVLEMPVVVT
jgi:hypothetical protein